MGRYAYPEKRPLERLKCNILPDMSRILKGTLRNGIRVLTEEMADIGSVTVGVWINVGSRNESANESGISHFIEHLLFKGTKKRNSIDIAREIESVGGVLDAFTSREYTCFFAKVLSKDTALAINLLSDILINSTFDKKELEKERYVILQEIKMEEDTPDDLIHDLFFQAMWKGHSLGQPVLGSMQTVGSISRKDVVSYFKKFYYPGTTIITAAGNLKHNAITELLDHSFGQMEGAPGTISVSLPVACSVSTFEQRELEQVHLCFGVPALHKLHPDRYKLILLNTILGGGMSSRLFQEIREKRGLAYSVYSYLDLCSDAGTIAVYAGTAANVSAKVVCIILDEFEKLKEDISRKELSIAKEYLIGSMMIDLESNENRMMKLAKDLICFGKVNSLDDIISNIKSVTVTSLKKLAIEIFDPGKAVLAAIGKVREKELSKVMKGYLVPNDRILM